MNHISHRLGSASTLINLLLFSLFSLILLANPGSARAEEGLKEEGLELQPFSDLNLRFSNRPLTPPDTLIVQTIPLAGLSVARPFVAPAPQAVIFEDDRRQRVAVLSTDNSGTLTLYLLEHLPLDPKLPALFECAHNRGCEADRTPLTGGLGCLALCIKDLLELSALNQ
ncbi:MAG: hypothetical protein KC592_13825 [Nitrospira sp.]|nr:hypothetical protein [Nitrospira sp.]HBP88139.1 hypothetical protein [Nitrospiraceae bacterium]HNP31538.1 hypothetical protein [Nitrospirales bacterium]